MRIEIICIGDELLSGRTPEKNANWLAKFLEHHGYLLNHVTLIADDEIEILNTLKNAFTRSHIIFLSGGLGPTMDDLTKKTLAKYFNIPLVNNDGAKKIAERNYHRKGLGMESNFYQIIPSGFIPCDNPKGLAPGLIKLLSKKILLAAPGVPWEFSTMVEKIFFPLIIKHFKQRPMTKMTIRTSGIPEESIFFKYAPSLWEKLSRYGKVASLPHAAGVDLVISQIDPEKNKFFKKEIRNIINNTPIRPFVWQYGDDSLEMAIFKSAKLRNIKFAIAESASGGLVSHQLTSIPGISSQYLGSIISYSNESKIKILGVKRSSIKKHGAVSTEVSIEMAKGILKLFPADLAIAISGITGPGRGGEKKAVGEVCIGWANKLDSGAEHFQFRGDRQTLKSHFTQKCLFILLKKLSD